LPRRPAGRRPDALGSGDVRRNETHGPLPAMLLALAVGTGLVDAISYLLLGHVFVALTGLAADVLTGGATPPIRRRLVSVLAMFAGGLVGALFVLRWTTTALILPPVLLLAVCVGAGLAARSQASWTRPR